MISLKDARKDYDNIFVIGRFQPLHKGHMQMLSNSFNAIWPNELTIIIGFRIVDGMHWDGMNIYKCEQ